MTSPRILDTLMIIYVCVLIHLIKLFLLVIVKYNARAF